MSKDVPDCPKKPKASQEVIQEFKIELMTPMFGGGVEAGMPDRTLPIRGTSIRGHLQFWWRATRGASCDTRDKLFARHARIWGTTERASPVQVEVRNVQCDAPIPCAEYRPNNGGKLRLSWKNPFLGTALPYVLFPFQGQLTDDRQQVKKEPAYFINKASFILRMRFPGNLQEEVRTAISAWVNFGGLGARTRRGCGSLYCEQFVPKDVAQLNSWLKVVGFPFDGAVRDWPTMPGAILVHPEDGDPLSAWGRIVERFKYFRQGEGFARNLNQGRSRYPEPETIRRITDRRWAKHEPWENMPDGFPRAELGLPIVFHFKDETKGEPRQTTLNPYVDGTALERMSSPLILKPLVLSNRNAVPLILRLTTRGVQQVELQDSDGICLTPRHAVPVQAPSLAQSGSPLYGLSTSGSAVEAFLNMAQKQNGFKEYPL